MLPAARGVAGGTGPGEHVPASEAALRGASLEDAVDGSGLPVLFFHVEHVAAILGTKASAAREAIVSGKVGPYSRIGRRLLVRRESFIEAIRAREIQPRPRAYLGPTSTARTLASGRGRRRVS